MIDKVALISVKNRRMLFTRPRNRNFWVTPGGKREGMERDAETLARELREELDVELDRSSLVLYGIFEAPAPLDQPPGTMVRLTCYTGTYTGEPHPSNEVEEFSYLASSDKEKTTSVGRLLLDDLIRKRLID